MKPIGIISIPRKLPKMAERPFERIMAMAGFNTGNLLFTNAVWEQIEGPLVRHHFEFNPAELNTTLRAVVIPAANWFGPHVNFADLANRIEQLDIPVVLIGLGTQDGNYSGDVDVPEGTVRFVRAVAERSRSISVRGDYTRDILKKYGIRNVTVTGCPSLYHGFRPNSGEVLLRKAAKGKGTTLLHSTRYSAEHRPFADSPSLHLDLFRLAYQTKTDLLLQSEPEEISLLVDAPGKPEITEALKTNLCDIYQAASWDQLEAYLVAQGRVFFDIASWTRGMRGYGRAFGTRLHATIMALNSGIPALLAHHDSRTKEVCEFACLPAVAATDCSASLEWLNAAFREADFEQYIEVRQSRKSEYLQFLLDNALPPSVTAKT